MSNQPTRGVHYGWFVLAGAFMGMTSFSVSRHLYPYVLPTMERELGLLHERMGNIASAYFVAYTIMTVVWGIVCDRIGSRKPMAMGMLLISVGLLSVGFARNFYMVLISYLLCGAGAAGLAIPQAPLLSRWFGPRLRGTAIGLAMSGSGFLTLVLGLVAPLLLPYGWPWMWWAGSAFVFLMAIGGWLVLVDRPDQKGLAPLGLRPAPAARPVTIAGGAQTAPLKFNLSGTLRQWTVWNFGLSYGLWGAGYVVFMTFAVAYLIEIGWSPKVAAGIFALAGGLSMIGPPLWGLLADRIAKKYVLALVISIQCFGLVALLNGSFWGSYIGAAAFGLGLVGVPSTMASSMADYFEPQVIGSTFGIITLMFGVGTIIGPSVAGYLADTSGTLGVSLLFSLAAMASGFVVALALRKPVKV